MIKQVNYSQLYKCKPVRDKEVAFKFTRDEDGTNLIFIIKEDGKLDKRKFLITKEDEIDSFDIENINDIIKSQNLELA